MATMAHIAEHRMARAAVSLTILSALSIAGCADAGESPLPPDGAGGSDAETLVSDTSSLGADSRSLGDTTFADDSLASLSDTAPDDGQTGNDTDSMPVDIAPLDTDDVGDAPQTPCQFVDEVLSCAHHTTVLTPSGPLPEARDVHWQVPSGVAPDNGWPVVFLFQGSFLAAEGAWAASESSPLGTWNRTLTIEALLSAGYAVLTPEAHLDGATFWDTNIAPYNVLWNQAPDHQLMLTILGAIEDGTFGALDSSRLYAAGFSSGGYMASRCALTYPNVRAIVVHSASFATCAGHICTVPPLDSDHVPTLLLHGTADTVVPLWTSTLYFEALEAVGVKTELMTVDGAAHEWLAIAPEAIVSWFNLSP